MRGASRPQSRGVVAWSDPRGARRPPSCRRREASFLVIRTGQLPLLRLLRPAGW